MKSQNISVYIFELAREIECRRAFSLLNNLQMAGIPVRHQCGGKAQCGTCVIKIIEGYENLSPPNGKEKRKLKGRVNPYRLACQSYLKGPVQISIPYLSH